tara:strand:- start:1671 stop:2483 length:813 start_codon:yes stop_codon:yes gene_type:complete
MKAVVIGGGSIGKRHSNNLNDLGIETRIVDVDEIQNIDNILEDNLFDIGLVCSPNIYHIEHCIKLATHNIPIFCEKPFYSTDVGLEQLLSIVEDRKLTTMVGCNLRFNPKIEAINPNAKYINVYFGYDLKKWRPNTNHLKSYSANKHLGGGVLLDVIHELDYLYSRFGSIKDISYIKDRLTDITNDTEDLVVGRVVFNNGTIADFTLNYLSETYQRYYDVLDEGVLKRVDVRVDNKDYVNQIKHFIECVQLARQSTNNFREAHGLLKSII